MKKRYFVVDTRLKKAMKFEIYDKSKGDGQFVFCAKNSQQIPVYTKIMANKLIEKSYDYRVREKFETQIEYQLIECIIV